MRFIILFFIALNLFSEEFNIFKPELKEVTLYRNNAELYNTGVLNLKSGINDYYIVGLANAINANTILFTSENSQLYSLEVVNNFRNEDVNKIKPVKDSIDLISNSIDILNIENKTIDAQLDYYNSVIKTVPNDKQKFTVQELEQYQNLIAKKLSSLLNDKLKVQVKIKTNNEILGYLKTKLSRLESEGLVTAIKVTIKSNINQKSDFKLNYITANAGWNLSYDLALNKVGEKAILSSKANIHQQTGIDWKDVNLVINDASQFNEFKPIVYPWEVRKEERKYTKQMLSGASNMMAEMDDKSKVMTLEYIHDSDINAESVETYSNESYIIPDKISIENNTSNRIINYNSENTNVELYFYAAPKFNESVFLIAKLLDYKTLNLKNAEVTTYLEGVYRGKVFLDLANADIPEVSFGTIDDVKVERKRISEFTEDKFLSSNKIRNYKYSFKITNNKNTKINFLLMEHIPLVKSDDFKLEVVNLSGAKKDENNILSWKFDLDAKKSIEKILEFNLTYPEGYILRD